MSIKIEMTNTVEEKDITIKGYNVLVLDVAQNKNKIGFINNGDGVDIVDEEGMTIELEFNEITLGARDIYNDYIIIAEIDLEMKATIIKKY